MNALFASNFLIKPVMVQAKQFAQVQKMEASESGTRNLERALELFKVRIHRTDFCCTLVGAAVSSVVCCYLYIWVSFSSTSEFMLAQFSHPMFLSRGQAVILF